MTGYPMLYSLYSDYTVSVQFLCYTTTNRHILPKDYVHRIGRTGRAGNKGDAITFFTPAKDCSRMTHITT